MDYIFTSESVCQGHPDKICDSISDAILDEVIGNDNKARVAVETLVAFNKIVIVGEVTSKTKIDYEKIARRQIKNLGYVDPKFNFTYNSPLELDIHEQSSEISKGVDIKGAGDQGMMFGYACNETKTLMPLPITLAHELAKRIDEVREKSILPFLRPDGKTQVTIEYKNGIPKKVSQVVIAVPHNEETELKEVKNAIYKEVVQKTLSNFNFKIDEKDLIVNGTGVWHMPGPASDSGLTGRKIIVDTYGGYARVGGGAFSGKDPTKVDRSGAYAARFIAKHIVKENLAEKAEVRLAYFIGAKKPVMLEVETFGTEKKPLKIIKTFMENILDTSVLGIINTLKLQNPIYLKTSAYGHFGREEFPWEKV
jgi:S-adenosylmethionine synthetase